MFLIYDLLVNFGYYIVSPDNIVHSQGNPKTFKSLYFKSAILFLGHLASTNTERIGINPYTRGEKNEVNISVYRFLKSRRSIFGTYPKCYQLYRFSFHSSMYFLNLIIKCVVSGGRHTYEY